MLVNVYCPFHEINFSLKVSPDIIVRDFKSLCAKECGVSIHKLKLCHNNDYLTDEKRTLKSYHLYDHSMVLMDAAEGADVFHDSRTEINISSSSNSPARFKLPCIDFSNIRTALLQLPSRDSQPGRQEEMPKFLKALSSKGKFREVCLNNPDEIETIRSIYPPVVDAMLGDNERQFAVEFTTFCDLLERPHISTSSIDVEGQRRIAEEIKQININESMELAIEEHPESFIHVAMLWINMKVNGHHVKAFVDTGAQMTIMSIDCAKRCNMTRMIDRRFEGLALGVGTQKIVGRIHLAQIQIENVYLQCSFAIMENQTMDVLLGLDMLRRHSCVVDLSKNLLVIGTNNTKTYFLSEREQPSMEHLYRAAISSAASKSQ